jgi:hypothetical protein
MVCLRNISVDTLHKEDTEEDNNNNNNNNNNNILMEIPGYCWPKIARTTRKSVWPGHHRTSNYLVTSCTVHVVPLSNNNCNEGRQNTVAFSTVVR